MHLLPDVVDLDAVSLPTPSRFDYVPFTIGVSATGHPSPLGQLWLEHADFSLTEVSSSDSRFIAVESIETELELCRTRAIEHPFSTRVLLDVLRALKPGVETSTGLVMESLAYSTLQAGPEFGEWLNRQGPRRKHIQDGAVLTERIGDELRVTFNRPDRHNAFSDALRQGLLEALSLALIDDSIQSVLLRGAGASFCSGGDLGEFGMFTDPANSHIARTAYSPARLLDGLHHRLGRALRADVHGAVLGSGLEMASYCGTVVSDPGSQFGLPELQLGLIPGAGGTVSVPRRIGRWRTAYLTISGIRIDAKTALAWGLVDDIHA